GGHGGGVWARGGAARGRAGMGAPATAGGPPADRKAVDAIEKLIGRTIEWAKAPARPERQERPEREPRHRPAPAPRRPERPSPPQPAPVARIEGARPQRRPAPPRHHGVVTSAPLPASLSRPHRARAKVPFFFTSEWFPRRPLRAGYGLYLVASRSRLSVTVQPRVGTGVRTIPSALGRLTCLSTATNTSAP